MKGTRILISSPSRGFFEHVYITGVPEPGVCMEIKPSTEPVGGLFNYQMYGTQAASGEQYISASGNRKAVAILMEKDDVGGIYSRAYVANEIGRIYWPAMGEQFNIVVANVSGTGDTFIIGQEMMLEDGTGQLVTGSSSEACPFTMLETVATALTVDTRKWVRFNGECGA